MDGYDCEPTDYEKVEALQQRVAELQTQNAALIEACQAAERLCLLGPFDSGADLEADRLHVWGLCAGALELVGVAQNEALEPAAKAAIEGA